MSLFLEDADCTLYHGDALDVLRGMPSESVDCVVTSPPYWGLRDYGNDGQLGLEETPDLFVAAMVAVFREVRRVLAPHGTCWVNLGDSFASSGTRGDTRSGFNERYFGSGNPGKQAATAAVVPPNIVPSGLKPKDLVGIPWRVAFALQQPYYSGRIPHERDRVWMAAMLDAEGTICGFRHERPDGNIRTGALTFITNGSERILDECDRIWPGARYAEHLKEGDVVLGATATRPCWRWEIQKAEERSAFMREMYPYLIEKQRQALVAWNMLELVQAAKRMGRGGETTEVKEKRDYLAQTLSDLNKRRPVDLPSWLKEPPALFEPGWFLRSDVVWSKKNPMPESVTDRPTKSHEYVFLLTKQPRYFFDQEAVREPHTPDGRKDTTVQQGNGSIQHRDGERWPNAGRNVRSVWTIATQPYPEAHFATYPEELVRRCVLAGCAPRVCRVCSEPSVRLVESVAGFTDGTCNGCGRPEGQHIQSAKSGMTTRRGEAVPCRANGADGWSDCGHNDWRPGLVLDPFVGSGTTCKVARDHGRHSIGIDLNADYLALAATRLQQLSLLTGEAHASQ